jgi:hypothetical protein
MKMHTETITEVSERKESSSREEDGVYARYRICRAAVKPSMQVLLYSFKIIMYVAAARSLY